MKYLHIKGKSASLIVEDLKYKDKDKDKNKNIPSNVLDRVSQLSEEFPNDKFYVFGGDDILHPVKFTNASNMLAAFCNLRTVPSKPKVYNKIDKSINLKRPEICDKVAETGYVKYHTYIDNESYVEQVVGTDGNYYNIYRNVSKPGSIGGGEIFKGEKLAFNSNRKDTTSIYPDENPIKGIYDYQMLLRYFMDDYNHPLYVKIRDFINELLGVSDFQKIYDFKQMANAIYDLRKSSEHIDKLVNDFVLSIEKDWKFVAKQQKAESSFPIWMFAIFHQGKLTKSNNIYSRDDGKHSVTFVRESRDVDHFRIPVDMEMIFKVDDTFENVIRNGRGVASILDGGICEIVGLTEYEPEPNYEENWCKI